MIHLPSGEKCGQQAAPGSVVIRRSALPSALAIKRVSSPYGPPARAKTIRPLSPTARGAADDADGDVADDGVRALAPEDTDGPAAAHAAMKVNPMQQPTAPAAMPT
jgi:hypothetical protein